MMGTYVKYEMTTLVTQRKSFHTSAFINITTNTKKLSARGINNVIRVNDS